MEALNTLLSQREGCDANIERLQLQVEQCELNIRGLELKIKNTQFTLDGNRKALIKKKDLLLKAKERREDLSKQIENYNG